MSEFRSEIETYSLSEILKLKNECDNRYYNSGEETIEDEKYDVLIILGLKKSEKQFFPVGSQVCEKQTTKVKLPYRLPGMDKIKFGEDEKLEQFLKRYKCTEYVISEKLNGVSCLIIFDENSNKKMYTRGDTVEGSDISHLSKCIQNLPDVKNMAVRGELIITKKDFEEKWKTKYKNALSLIVSVVNANTIKDAAYDLHFLAYEMVEHKGYTQLKQFEILESMLFKLPDFFPIAKEDIHLDFLKDCVSKRKSNGLYDIDGLILHVNMSYDRNDVSASQNPNYAIAFKTVLEVTKMKVKYVEWNASKWGVLKPRICLEPQNVGGVTISYTSGFNAAFIRDHKINTNSELLMTRSGDVIPFILEVVKEAEEAGMPKDIHYRWNDTNVDIMVEEENLKCIKYIFEETKEREIHEQVLVQKLVHFFVALHITNVNEGIIRKFVKKGYDTIPKILSCSVKDISGLENVKDKMASKIYDCIHSKLDNVMMADLLYACGIFGMGIGLKKIQKIVQEYPNFLLEKKEFEKKDFTNIEGFQDTTAEKIVAGIPLFFKISQIILKFIKLKSIEEEDKDNVLFGKKIVFSQFRDASLQDKIQSCGGIVENTVTKKTDFVVVKDFNTDTDKIRKAKDYGIPILQIAEILQKTQKK